MSIIRKNMATSKASGTTSAARERGRAVAEIKAQTADALRSFESERTAMAKALKTELAADRVNRSAEVLEIRDNASAMSQEFRQAHELMRETLRQSLVSDRLSRSAEVLAIRDDASAMSQGFRQDHGQMRRDLRQALVESKQDVSNAVAALFHEFDADRAEFTKALRRMAAAQGASLARDRRERARSSIEFKAGVSSM